MDHLRGTVVLNYRLVEKLGEGGFGAVYRARHEDLGREVAIKVLRADRAAHPGVVERFLREARIICDIGHPAIVEIENAGRLPSGEPFYVMELVPGESLAQRLARRGPLSPRDALRVFAPLADALAAAHAKGIIHRDFKPHNVMVVERDGAIVAARLLDFGIAKLLTAGDASSTGEVMGSPHFMAPEQALDSKRTTATADVYAFAASLFNALTGRRPFDGASVPAVLLAVQQTPPPRLSTVAPAAPAALDDAIDRCLAKEPTDRPATILEAWADLRAGLEAAGELELVPPLAAPDPRERTVTSGSTSASASAGSGEVDSLRRGFASTASASPPPVAPPRRRWPALVVGLLVVGGGLAIAYPRLRGTPAVTPTVTPGRATVVDAGALLDAAPSAAAIDAAPPLDAAADDLAVDAGLAVDARAVAPLDAGARDGKHRSGAERPRRVIVDAGVSVAPPPPPPPPVLPPVRCERSTFAEVYQAAYPTREEVRAALSRLRTCKARGLISEGDYTSIQSALVARL